MTHYAFELGVVVDPPDHPAVTHWTWPLS